MKLKSIELIGFKSFAKKTKLDFPAGITEIVGPNGSGKSNIIEAIRWALGEQSAKNLRSSRMTDVIFSGSQSHAALNRAKVTLVFDNRDHFIDVKYNEIKVSRTVFRDGTNNYYLNGKPCRLRDIQDLFMNTGIGTGSFSIISQGKVAQIFKSKPVDRRFIIETVAGIYKYRSQKEVAAKKLSRVDDNLTRIHDLTYELKQRCDTLGRERHTAQQYLRQKHLANHLDVARLSVRLNQLRKKRSESQSRLRNVNSIQIKLKRHVAQLQKKSHQVRQALDQASKSYDQAQEWILEHSQRLDNLTNQNSLSRQKLSFWHQQIHRYKSRLTKNSWQIKHLNTDLNGLKRQQETVDNKVIRITKVLSQLSAKRTPSLSHDHRLKINRLRSTYVDLIKRSARVKGQIEDLHQDRRHYRLQVNDFRQQVIKLRKLIDQVQVSLKSAERDGSKLKRTINRIDGNSLTYQKRYQQNSNQFQAVRNEYHNNKRKLQITQIRLGGLKRINARHSNLYNGTRNLLNHQNQFTGILGPVTEFIRVPTTDIQAIETTLRSQLQQIIVDNSQTAKRIVQFMSDRHLGRVTLLPMNAISKRWIDPAIIRQCQEIPGFIDVASKLVKMPKRFTRVKLHLLGNVLITKDISAAIQISRIVHRRYRVVTLDGNVINSGGAVTGGHGRYRYHGLLSQKAKADQYRDTVVKLGRLVKQDRIKGIHLVKQLKLIKNQMQTNQGRGNEVHQRLAIKTNLRKRLLAELRNYQNILGQRQSVWNSNDKPVNLSRLQNKQYRIQERLNKTHQKLNSERKALTQQSKVTQHYDQQCQDHREKLIKVRDQQSRFHREFKAETNQLSQLLTNNQRLKREITQFRQSIDKQTRHVQSNDKLRALSRSIDQLTAKKMHFRGSVDHQHQFLSKLGTKISKAQDQLIALRNQVNQNKLTGHEVSQKLREVIEVLFRKYQINVAKIDLPKPSEGLYQISSKLYRVQKQLRGIGPVNVNSIDQFKKVNHRYQFLSKQIDDLITSQKQLTKAMGQMNSKIKIRFKSTFDRINRAFSVTYSQIFKGGKAKLSLIDPKHLLTTGVNIMAQPPGKRYRNMELLSGGERALTAIALLFAILKIKPAPFCILDEAESALDAINIDRFGDYMQRLKAKTQFIVITHRKTTMLYADNLYGVTMQDSGISKIISVNLKKAKTEG